MYSKHDLNIRKIGKRLSKLIMEPNTIKKLVLVLLTLKRRTTNLRLFLVLELCRRCTKSNLSLTDVTYQLYIEK